MKTKRLQLIEAAESGRLFKRCGWEDWINCNNAKAKSYRLSMDDILANDWQIITPAEAKEYWKDRDMFAPYRKKIRGKK